MLCEWKYILTATLIALKNISFYVMAIDYTYKHHVYLYHHYTNMVLRDIKDTCRGVDRGCSICTFACYQCCIRFIPDYVSNIHPNTTEVKKESFKFHT